MLDIKFIREHPDEVKEACRKKGVDFALGRLLEVDERRRKVLLEVEGLRGRQKRMSTEIYRKKGGADQGAGIDEMRNLKAQLRYSEKDLRPIEDEFLALMRMVPNLPLPEVPEGKDETENHNYIGLCCSSSLVCSFIKRTAGEFRIRCVDQAHGASPELSNLG